LKFQNVEQLTAGGGPPGCGSLRPDLTLDLTCCLTIHEFSIYVSYDQDVRVRKRTPSLVDTRSTLNMVSSLLSAWRSAPINGLSCSDHIIPTTKDSSPGVRFFGAVTAVHWGIFITKERSVWGAIVQMLEKRTRSIDLFFELGGSHAALLIAVHPGWALVTTWLVSISIIPYLLHLSRLMRRIADDQRAVRAAE
jgi:hypothetical protein